MRPPSRSILVTLPFLAIGGVAGVAAATDGSPGSSAHAAAARVNVTLKEFKLTPSRSSVGSGRVTFAVKNSGRLEHEFIVIKTSRRAARLPVSGNKANETGEVAEAEDIAPGRTRTLSVRLKRGHYALICNIRGHYKAGQFADFTVR